MEPKVNLISLVLGLAFKISILDARAPTVISERIYNTLKKHGFNVELVVNVIKKQKSIMNTVARYTLYNVESFKRIGNVLHVINTPYIPYVSSLLGKNIVLHYTDEVTEKMRISSRRIVRIAAKFVGKIEDMFLKKSIVIITPNFLLKNFLIDKHGVSSKKIIVIPNLPPKSFKPRNKVHIRKKKPVAIFVGSLRELFNWDLLIKTAKILRDKVDFWILGEGTYLDYLKKYAPSNVKFFGWVKYSLVPDYINLADVAIIPIRSGYARFGDYLSIMKLGEYMALRKPIVATGINPSDKYIVVNEKPEEFAEAILRAIKGEAPIPEPLYWEDISEKKLVRLYKKIVSELNNTNR